MFLRMILVSLIFGWRYVLSRLNLFWIMQVKIKKYHIVFTDCTAPFQVAIVTDAMTDTPDATTASLQQSKGKYDYNMGKPQLRQTL